MFGDAQFVFKFGRWLIVGIMLANSSTTFIFDIDPVIVNFVNPRPASNMF